MVLEDKLSDIAEQTRRPLAFSIEWADQYIVAKSIRGLAVASSLVRGEIASGSRKSSQGGFINVLQKAKRKRKEKHPSVEMPRNPKRTKVSLPKHSPRIVEGVFIVEDPIFWPRWTIRREDMGMPNSQISEKHLLHGVLPKNKELLVDQTLLCLFFCLSSVFGKILLSFPSAFVLSFIQLIIPIFVLQMYACRAQMLSRFEMERDVAAVEDQEKRDAVNQAVEATLRAEELSKREANHLAHTEALERRLDREKKKIAEARDQGIQNFLDGNAGDDQESVLLVLLLLLRGQFRILLVSTMTNPEFETYGTKSFPIVIQSEGSSFKVGIILNDTNYDLWSQIMEMHIAEKEKLSFIRDHRDKVIMESENDVESYRKSVQRQRVHIFLAGLDGEFEQVRAEILRKDPIPELEACHALIRRESVRRTKMVEESERTEASAMVTRYRPSQNQPKPTNAADKSTYKCTHCNQNGHTKNRCYELVGYPEWWDHNRDPRKRNSKRTSSTAVVETKTEDDVTRQHSALAATAGNGGKALNMSTLVTNNAWIIDSGATDHMTFDSRQVSTLKQSSQKFVTTANGTPTPIVGEGHLPLTSNMNLDSVLVVPSLDYNLLSVSQITTALFCVVIFWPNFCVFKDIRTRQTIGCGVRRGKLYYLDLVSNSSDKLRQALMVNDSEGEMRKSEIWLWHRRLGHASFGYLKKLFPSLFTKCDVSSFQCEVCELAKSHRVSFPLALNKSPDPFMIIHSDVWGPSKVNSLGGSRWFVTFIDDCTRMTWVQLMKSKRYAAHQKGYRCYHPPTHKMFITLDVVFHEDLMYFSTESELQGEHQKEIQTLDYDDELTENVDVHISEDTQISEDVGILDISEDELAEPVNQVGKFVEESSQEHAETEVVTPSQFEFDIPHATNTPHQSLAEDAPEPHRK
ncbi:hypothetical protein RJ640_014987 [Escallonia rubra]|uniref:GAG-pre-integrase domain-containing protein n=1 Tax=Escallonia rubra TaxID=112253 RepID=A0AA88UNK1_9ASTE|nr:hypothetical protein RJ640_014987 [Escallonia rubra]